MRKSCQKIRRQAATDNLLFFVFMALIMESNKKGHLCYGHGLALSLHTYQKEEKVREIFPDASGLN